MKSNVIPMMMVLLISALGVDIYQTHSPAYVSRASTIWKWCDCGKGLEPLTIWPTHQPQRNVTVNMRETKWIKF